MASKKTDEPSDSKAAPPKPRRRAPVVKLVLWGLIMSAAAGGLGYVSFTLWQENKDHKADLEKAQWAADSCNTNLTAAEGRVAKANQDYATCNTKYDDDKKHFASVQANVDRLEKNLKAGKEELENLRKQRAEVEKRLEAFRDMTDKLKAMIDSGQLEVKVREGRMLVELPSEVMFPSGSAELSKDGEMALMKVAVILEQFPDRVFMVAGHTDNQPLKSSKYASNRELSTGRAVTVTEFLIRAGLKPGNLIAAGYGEHDPVAPNKTAQGRARNRRIEIVLMPSIEELPTIPDDMLEDAKKPDDNAPKKDG